jgi:hypothetical protein
MPCSYSRAARREAYQERIPCGEWGMGRLSARSCIPQSHPAADGKLCWNRSSRFRQSQEKNKRILELLRHLNSGRKVGIERPSGLPGQVGRLTEPPKADQAEGSSLGELRPFFATIRNTVEF